MAHRSRCYGVRETKVYIIKFKNPSSFFSILYRIFKIIFRYASDFANIDDDADVTDVSQWADLANIVCDGIDDGPPPRRLPGKKPHLKDILMGVDNPEDDDSLLKTIDTDEVRTIRNIFLLRHFSV